MWIWINWPAMRAARKVTDAADSRQYRLRVIRRWKQLAPESATLHWMGGTEEALAKRIAALRAPGFASITQLQIHVRIGKDGTMTPSAEFLLKTGAELRGRNILFQTLPWQSNDPAMFRRLMDWARPVLRPTIRTSR